MEYFKLFIADRKNTQQKPGTAFAVPGFCTDSKPAMVGLIRREKFSLIIK